MKQIVQNYRTGELWLEEVPTPICRSGGVLVRNEFSVVSTGTERMKVDQARMSLLAKAKERPDQVKKVLQNVQQVGLRETFNKVQERLDALTTLGYSSVGRVVEVGATIDHLQPGDQVVCAGEGIACHAEYVSVPKNLCVRVPEGTDARQAAFATVGAIAMNGVRQAQVGLGDVVLVIGLGLVGLLAVQILRAAGCRVIGVDIAQDKLALALDSGAEATFSRTDPALMASIMELTGGHGVDCAYIAASSKSSDPMALAGETVRDRGNVVIVGMVPIEADWRIYYAKELSVILSRSYGPGRYDRNFEDKGIDYPIGYVPWTQKRNLQEFVRLVSQGMVSPTKFGAQEYAFSDAPQAYSAIHESPGKHAAGIIFRYDTVVADAQGVTRSDRVVHSDQRSVGGKIGIGLIGAGNFATGTLIPALKESDQVNLRAVCSAGGLTAKGAANRHAFEYATSEYSAVLEDEQVHAVVIATRHNTHAAFTIEALQAGKSVFVEKPLALDTQELTQVVAAANASTGFLMPGFNRRFSPLAKAVQGHFSPSAGPLEVMCRVNAGHIEAESWYQDTDEGGWRIVSEGCHWIDLISFIVQSEPISVSANMIGGDRSGGQNDNCIALLEFANGSIASLGYLSNGDPTLPKERLEVFGQQRAAVIDNWRIASLHAGGKTQKVKPQGTGKGHGIEMQQFVRAVADGAPSPISLSSAAATTLAALKIQESMQAGGRRIALE